MRKKMRRCGNRMWLMIAGGPAAASGGYGPNPGTGGAAGGGHGGSWNSWNMAQNGPPPGTQPSQPPQPNSSQPNSNSNPAGEFHTQNSQTISIPLFFTLCPAYASQSHFKRNH